MVKIRARLILSLSNNEGRSVNLLTELETNYTSVLVHCPVRTSDTNLSLTRNKNIIIIIGRTKSGQLKVVSNWRSLGQCPRCHPLKSAYWGRSIPGLGWERTYGVFPGGLLPFFKRKIKTYFQKN